MGGLSVGPPSRQLKTQYTTIGTPDTSFPSPKSKEFKLGIEYCHLKVAKVNLLRQQGV